MKKPLIHPADLQANLKKAGIRQKDVAEQLDVSESAVSTCIKGGQGARIREHLAAVLRFDPRDAWPQYYSVEVKQLQINPLKEGRVRPKKHKTVGGDSMKEK